MWGKVFLCGDLTSGFFVASELKVALSSQSPQLETVRLFKHHLSLIQISQPVSLHCWQNWRFPEVETDDRIGKMNQATVIGELRSDAVHNRYRTLSNTVDETRNPEMTFSLEYQRVQPGIREPRIDHIDPLEAGDRSQKKPVI